MENPHLQNRSPLCEDDCLKLETRSKHYHLVYLGQRRLCSPSKFSFEPLQDPQNYLLLLHTNRSPFYTQTHELQSLFEENFETSPVPLKSLPKPCLSTNYPHHQIHNMHCSPTSPVRGSRILPQMGGKGRLLCVICSDGHPLYRLMSPQEQKAVRAKFTSRVLCYEECSTTNTLCLHPSLMRMKFFGKFRRIGMEACEEASSRVPLERRALRYRKRPRQ